MRRMSLFPAFASACYAQANGTAADDEKFGI
jgi:hypothetical protein